MNDDHIAYIGMRDGWGGELPVGLRTADRRQHTYVVGKTGTGKSTLLRNLIAQDIEAGRGVGLIDPHGDLAAEVLNDIPRWRTDHTVYFNPADREWPIGLNLLQNVAPDSRHLVASGLVSTFKSIWRESWGPRLEYILYSTLVSLLDCDNVSLLGVQRMLVDANYRAWVIRQVADPLVRMFWDEFANYDDRFMREAIAPIQNKIGQFLTSPPIRNILGQVRSTIDFRYMIDNNRIFVANLAKGKLGEEKANLLGSLMVTQFQLAAMGRADVPEDQRRDFTLVIDEAHNFTTDSFGTILSEMRKYRLGIVLSTQFQHQLREDLREAVFGNVGTIIAFRVGEGDARILEREFGGAYAARTFTDLGNYRACVKALENGEPGDPFLMRNLPPIRPRNFRRDTLIRRSRERFATPRAVVESRIHRWLEK